MIQTDSVLSTTDKMMWKIILRAILFQTMPTFLKLVLLINLANEIFAQESDLLVVTPLGMISGFYKTTNLGHSYRGFEGIPYAKPPVGNLRFEPPQPYGPWEGTLMATSPQIRCLQYDEELPNPSERVAGAEDCLYLNIYTPLPNPAKNESHLVPVLFYIHGGVFNFGSGHDQGPSYLINRDLIYVNFNYRLGIFGFISTGDEVVPGNMALKDQSLALRWIHENIKSFGGDRDRITIAGFSSGSISSHYHYLSPMSRGLFQGGISLSGTALNTWGLVKDSVEKTKLVGSLQGCPTHSSREMVECLKYRPARNIMQLAGQYQPSLSNPLLRFGPVVEKNSAVPFIDRSPVEIIASGDATDVPWITSIVSEEGIYPVAEFLTSEEFMTQLNENWEKIAPFLLDFSFTIPKSEHARVAAAIREHYFGNDKIERATVQTLIRMFGDRLYFVDSEKAAKLMAKINRSPVWFYYYSYRAPFSSADFFNVTGNLGVCHGDDENLIAQFDSFPIIRDQPTLNVQNILLDIIESFMQGGVPTTEIDWPKVDPAKECLEYLHISGPKGLTTTCHPNFGNNEFWSSIGFNENKLANV